MTDQSEDGQPAATDCLNPSIEVSLWDSLRDSRLRRVQSCAESSTVLLEFEIPHLTGFHKLPEEVRFLLSLHAVESLLAEAPPTWIEIESRLNGGSETAWIYEATLLVEPGGKVVLKLLGSIDDDCYPSMTIRAGSLSIRTSEGSDLAIEQFLKLGEDYWEAFAARSKAKAEGDAEPA